MVNDNFKEIITQGIPDDLPPKKEYDTSVSHAPKRKDILTKKEEILAIQNALRYFPKKHHAILAQEFAQELKTHGRIYMHRFRPDFDMFARPINELPCKSKQAAGVMHMYLNNLDPKVAQHPHELITYGGNGAVFQNWAQFRLTMKYLSQMTDEQTLVLNSGHPLGLFPSHKDAPRLVIANGMMIPNYSTLDEYERLNALGVTSYGQMTAGSAMYIGPQGIVHGTTITVLNAARNLGHKDLKGKLFVTSGLGGMSGAQAKAAVIAGAIGVIAEVNKQAIDKRHQQGWLNEKFDNMDLLLQRIRQAKQNQEAVSLGYHGNIIDLWERLAEEDITIELGSDQTSLHNPFAGGYYPAGLSFEESNKLMSENPDKFKRLVQESLKRHVSAINTLTNKGMYFWDYGNAFLLQAKKAGADVLKEDGSFKYPSYVEGIMGPICFDYGFGPFRWVCTSKDPKDLEKTDEIAAKVIQELIQSAPNEIKQQYQDNLKWITEAGKNNLVVGSQARILYSDEIGRIKIAEAFNKAIQEGHISAPIVIGRDHHDVSGTDSPYRETANIYDGSNLTADMAIQNVIGCSFRGATWVSIHNGGGVGWGEVINGGFGMLLDGSDDATRRLDSMIYWDVNNGIARRSWAKNKGAEYAIKRAMDKNPKLTVTMPHHADENLVKEALNRD